MFFLFSCRLNQRFDEVLNRIDTLTDLSNNNRLDIQNLQSEIKSLKDQKQNQISASLSNKLDQVVSQHLLPGCILFMLFFFFL